MTYLLNFILISHKRTINLHRISFIWVIPRYMPLQMIIYKFFFLIYYFLCPERKWYFPSLFSASNPPIRDSPYLGKTPTFNKVRRSVERIYFRFLHSLPSSPWFSPTQGWHYQLETFISPFPFTSNSAHWPQHLCPFLPLWAGDPPKKPLTHRLL